MRSQIHGAFRNRLIAQRKKVTCLHSRFCLNSNRCKNLEILVFHLPLEVVFIIFSIPSDLFLTIQLTLPLFPNLLAHFEKPNPLSGLSPYQTPLTERASAQLGLFLFIYFFGGKWWKQNLGTNCCLIYIFFLFLFYSNFLYFSF